MAKCQHCGNGIDNNEISYRPANTGSRRNQSIRLCYRCVEKHDRMQNALKVRNIGIVVLLAAGLVVFAIYLIMKR